MSNVIYLEEYTKKEEQKEDTLDNYIDVLSLSTDEILATLVCRLRGEIFNGHLKTENLILEAKARIKMLDSVCNTIKYNPDLSEEMST